LGATPCPALAACLVTAADAEAPRTRRVDPAPFDPTRPLDRLRVLVITTIAMPETFSAWRSNHWAPPCASLKTARVRLIGFSRSDPM
jgi:hypothetical protein